MEYSSDIVTLTALGLGGLTAILFVFAIFYYEPSPRAGVFGQIVYILAAVLVGDTLRRSIEKSGAKPELVVIVYFAVLLGIAAILLARKLKK